MAKKIVIEKTGILLGLEDPWGGINDTGSTIIPYSDRGATTEVPAGAEWGVSKEEIERFVKVQYGTKAGDFRWYKPNDVNFYSLILFATKADATAWDADHTLTNYIQILQLPISTVATDSYICRLVSEMSTSNNYVAKNGDVFNVNLRYQSVFVEGATSTSSNYSADGVITIERSVNAGSSWDQVARLTGQTSLDPTADTFPIVINLGEYLIGGMTNRFRIRASFQYTNEGVTKTSYSSYVTFNIASVNLALSMATDWATPITANASTTQMALNFTLFGSVQKYLTIKVDGATFINESPYDSTFNSEQTGNIPIIDSTKNIFRHGVHEVQAYLTCSNGNGGTLTSDVMVYHLMVINESTPGANLTQPFLLLQEIAENVDNFVQSKICKYSIYHPEGDDIELSLIICSSAQNYVTNPSTEYFRIESVAENGTQYNLNATLEIEDQTGDTLNSYLQVLRHDEGTVTNFLYETTGVYYQFIPIDNTAGYAPTAGTTFYLNPKIRNNSEGNPRRILNAANFNSEITSSWTNFKLGTQDGWLNDSDGNKMLRVPAGCLLNISFNPFLQFLTTPNSGMTMEFDIKVSNITNEDDPVIKICETSGNKYIGLRLKPMHGTITTASHTEETTSDFNWSEEERTHISINIHNAVAPNAPGDGLSTSATPPSGTLSLVRVLINGVINREFVFSTNSTNEFCTAELSNGGIFIGQEGADIDIYGIRIWASQQLSARNIVQNYISTIPSATKKEIVKKENDIIENGVVSLEKVKSLGKNYLIWHGTEIYHDADSTQRGWWEFGQYDDDGQLIPELSGTIGKATASLPSKGQGTTAKTYYYWNIQTKISDLSSTSIIVLISDLHESITVEDDADYEWLDSENNPTGEIGAYKLKGGNLGKDFPLPTESFVRYHKTTVDGADAVIVPDGWIDGNGKYRGLGYMIESNMPLAQKLVLKINYASSMQSHIIGVNKLYDELHTIYCGKNALQAATNGAVVAKHLQPFLFFTQVSDNASPVYRGPGAWGPGKMDKPAWGYVKSKFPNFMMIEGADNNKELTDMRVPFDDTVHGIDAYPKVYYNPSEEAFYYRVDSGLQHSQKCIDFDGGKTVEYSESDLDSTHLYKGEYPHSDLIAYIRDTWNFLFLHNPRIKPFITGGGTLGDYNDFVASSAAEDTGTKYWCSDYKLYRYDFADGAWVNAGLWNGNSYDVVNLLDSTAESGTLANATYSAWFALTSNQKADYEGYVNTAFINGIVAHAKSKIGDYFVVNSLKFHYAFENHFIAGTDNCSKNTYYVLVPTSGSMGSWSGWKFELHQDDVDTVLATDNSGLQSKPYYIDRMHPYEVIGYIWKNGSATVYTKQFKPNAGDFAYANPSLGSETSTVIDSVSSSGITIGSTTYSYDSILYSNNGLYEGKNNVLFNLCEAMWENTSGGIGDTLRSILGSMASLNGGVYNEASVNMSGVWKALNKYIFNVQRYIPAMAYNEAARIRYEFPKLINYVSEQRGVDPITQSMGDQLQAELQWMKRRLIYMASYAAAGEFMPATGRIGATGISDLNDSFGMTNVPLPNSTTENPVTSVYTFRLVPHQWMYPTGGQATTGINPHVRVAPGAANMPNGYFEFTINPTSTTAGDDGMTIFGINYYRSIGNIGDMCYNPSRELTLNGKRMTEFVAEPTIYYSTTPGGGTKTAEEWRALSDTDKASYLPAFRCSGVSVGSATRLSALSMNGCSSIGGNSIDIGGLTRAGLVNLSYTDILSVILPQTPTLTALMLPSKLTALNIQNCPSLNTLSMQGYESLTSLTVKDCPLLSSSTLGLVNAIKTAGSAMTYIDINNVSWQSPFTLNGDTMRWLLDIETCKLAGRIKMAPTSSTPSGRLYFDDVARLIKRYGNIYDSNITVDGNGLYVDFAQTPMTVASMSITGQKYINPADLRDKGYTGNTVTSGYYDDLALNVSTESNCNNPAAIQRNGVWMPDVKWTIETADMDSFARIEDEYSSSIHIVQIYELTIEIKVTVRDYNGNDRSVKKTIGLWRRIPQVGDYAWTDGEFDNENDTSKKLAGMVVMRQMLDENDNVTTNQAECVKYKLWVYGAANSTMPENSNTDQYGSSSGVGGVTTTCWGLYPANNANGLVDTKTDGTKYDDELLESIKEAVRGKSYNGHAFNSSNDIFDTPLSNMSGDVYLRKNADAVASYGSGVAMQDDNTADGWKVQTTTHLINFNGEDEKATLLAYADDVLMAVLTHFGIMDRTHLDSDDYWDESGNVHPKTRQALADLMQIVVMYCARAYMCDVFSSSSSTNYAVGKHVTYNGGYYTCIQPTTGGTFEENCWEPFEISDINMTGSDFTDVNPVRFREFLFPAARLADVWCPADASVNSGLAEEQLDEQYARGKWMLPASGLLARIFNFLGNSRQNYNGATNGSYDPVASQANEENDETKEAMLALFSNAMARGRSVSVSSSSIHWSSTEYGRYNARYVSFNSGNATYTTKYSGYVVRPVAAFIFVP